MTASRDRNRSETNVVTLGPSDSLVGTLRIKGDLTVQGTVEGEIFVSGDVTVDADATVQATIEGRNITIRGQVEGNVISQKRLQLSGSGTLTGDASVGRLVVEDGASFNGSITMGGASAVDSASDEPHSDTSESDVVDEATPEVEMVGAAESY